MFDGEQVSLSIHQFFLIPRELGFEDSAIVIQKSQIAFDVDYDMVYSFNMYNVECDGDESTLRDCSYDSFTGSCVEFGNVGIMCGNIDFGMYYSIIRLK